jgi:hypothetical protein
MRRRIGGLAKDLGSGRKGTDLHVFREIVQLGGIQILERWEADQEPSNSLDLRPMV